MFLCCLNALHFCCAGNGPPARKKQRGPRRERLIADKASEIQTQAEQESFWRLRDQHRTPEGSPNYSTMAAAFNVAFKKQVDLMQRQVRAPALPCNFAYTSVDARLTVQCERDADASDTAA